MFKPLFLSCCLVTTSIFAMQQNQLKPWVQSATTIQIKTTKQSYTINIDDNTAVLDIKSELLHKEGILLAQQMLIAAGTKYLVLPNNSPALANGMIIKAVMNEYNTDTFKLFLQSRYLTID